MRRHNMMIPATHKCVAKTRLRKTSLIFHNLKYGFSYYYWLLMNLFNCDLETIPVPFVKIPIVITLMFFSKCLFDLEINLGRNPTLTTTKIMQNVGQKKSKCIHQSQSQSFINCCLFEELWLRNRFRILRKEISLNGKKVISHFIT